MSSSFVKDCSDVSAPGNTSGKTVIIIVNNETGNVSLDGDELQNLLASHGADGSQVSVVRMGSGGVENLSEANITSSVTTTDGTQHVNLTVEGYPAIPVQGQIGNTGNYAELPLDADAFRRLESVLESEEAREILGEPLLDMVTNPEQLGTLDELMDSSLFEGDTEDAPVSGDVSTENDGSPTRVPRSPPKRRSQRQMDKAEREEVEKILAENQKKLQEEKQQLDESQVLARIQNLPENIIRNKKEDEEEVKGEENGVDDPKEKIIKPETENDKSFTAATPLREKDDKAEEETAVSLRGRGRGRGRGRARGKGEAGRDNTPEGKSRARGRKIIGEVQSETVPGRGRGGHKEDAVSAKGRGRGRGRGRTLNSKEDNSNIINIVESENNKHNLNYIPTTGIKMKELKVSVTKMEFDQAFEKKFSPNDEKNVNIIEEEAMKNSLSPETEENKSGVVKVVQVVEGPVDPSKRKTKKVPMSPKVIPQFEPALFSTPDVMLKVGEVNSTQAIVVKGNGKSVKTQKIFLVEKQIRKDVGLTSVSVKDEKQKENPLVKFDDIDKPPKILANTNESIILSTSDTNQKNSSELVSDVSVAETKASKFVEKKKIGNEVKPRVLQVKSPMGVRQVVVLNSAKAGMYRETLVKVIPPKDPPREDEKMSPAKQRMLAKTEGQTQKKKICFQKHESIDPITGAVNEDDNIKETFKGDMHSQGHVHKKTEGIEIQRIGDPHKSEEAALSKKKEEAQRKKEEIQMKRDELLRKREAIQKRKELQKKENIHQKRDDENEKKNEFFFKKRERNIPNNKSEIQKKDIEVQRKKTKEISNSPSKSLQVSKTNKLTRSPTAEESPVRRSNRAIKKKTFGDEMLTFDIKEDLAADVEEEQVPEEEVESEGDEDDESLEDYGEDDDPERLWCICQKPHNNRFMICCDKCEDWFHGSCVGVTKAIGQQMEEDGKEWVCPKCKKAERAMKGFVSPGKKIADISSCATSENNPTESETRGVSRPNVTKKGMQGGYKCDVYEEGLTIAKKTIEGVKKVDGQAVPKRRSISQECIALPIEEKKMDIPQIIRLSPQKPVDGRKECVVESCNKAPKADSIYCSNDCVLKHAQMSLKMLGKTDKVEEVQNLAAAVTTLEKSEPRVLVYQKSTRKILTGAEAPTLGQLKDWLKDHRDFAVLQPGMMGASGTVISTNTQLSAANFYGQKKIIQISPKCTAVPVGGSLGQKVTVVKSADGRILVKSSETLNKDVNKPVTTVSVPTPTKSVLVSATKQVIVPSNLANKEGEGKKDMALSSKKDDSTSAKNTPSKDIKKLSDSGAVPILNKPTSVEKKKPDPVEVRNNIKKTLADCLVKRYQDAKKEFDSLSENAIKDLAAEIEKELYTFFGKDVGFKYKSRYRSILFNTKDTKNSGLFRKILNGTISPANLVRMTSEELASKELCEWREREEKKELQAIEKYELDMIALGNQYIMKSHKGEIEIDKDEFIKDKEKAPETLNSLPADPLTEVLEDTTAGHANHIYDLNCKICTGKQDPSYTRQDSKSYDEISQEKPRRDKKEDKHKEPLKVKDRKERKSSSDKDKRERRESSDKERHKHRSKDTEKDKKSREERSKDKDKDRDYRDKDKIKSKDTNKDEHISDRDKDKSRVKHRNSKDGERERHKSISSNSNDKEKKDKERRDSRDKRDDQDRKHKDKHKDRRDSKGDKDRKRRDSEKSERKRKHSESRNDDRKRRESDKDISKITDKDDDEKQKVEVSTSEDVVFDSYQKGKHVSSHTDCSTKDAEPTSTVVGSPEVLEIKDYTSPITSSGIASPTLFPASLATPPLPPDSPEYIPPPPCDDISMCSPCDDVSVCSPCDDISACLPLTDRPMTSILPSESDIPTTPPLPEEIPTLPPLPSEDIPSAPPLPDGEIPPTPPLPDDDIPRTPPLPYEDFPVTPPLPSEDVPSTPPLPMSRSSTTPPLPNEDVSLTLPYSGSLLPPPPPPPQLLFSSEFNNDSDRLTPPPLGVQKPVVSSASLPTVISAESLNVWKGIIHMPDVAKFHASAFEVSGKAKFLPDDVPNSIEVVGRIAPETVWGYIAQMKKSGSKEILVVRFQPANEEEKVSYIALYSYLSSKKRYAVIGNCEKSVKDFYVVPLASHQPIPQVLLPLDGPGFEEHRAHMLIGVIIRAKSKRVFDHITGTWSVVGMGSGLPVQPVPKPHDLPERSYTPPLPTDEDIQEIALAAKDSGDDDDGTGERSSSARKNQGEESSVEFLDSGSLKRPATDSSEIIRPKKRHISSTSDSSVATSPFLTEEPNSPPEEIFVEASLDQESMLAELNRQIEEHKKELSEMQKTIGNEEEEPYSPSHGHSPPPPGGEQFKLDTSKISIPSNLQEILDNIRQKEVEIKQKEQEIKRRLSLTSDPIVMIYGKYQEFEKKKKIGDSITTASKADIDLRPLLQNKLNKDKKTDVDLRVLKKTDENKEKLGSKVDSSVKTDEDTDLRIRDPRLARAQTTAVVEKGKTLSKMSDEELLAKVSEMEDGDKISGQCHSETGAESLHQPAPPPFMQSGLAGGYLLQGGATMVPDGLACSVGPSQPPGMSGHMTYIGAMGPPQPVDMYGPPLGGRLQGSARHAGSHGPPDHTNSSGHSGTQGHSGYSGPPGPHGPQSHSGPHGSHGPQSHSGPHGPHGPQSHSGPHGPPSYASPHGLMRPRYSDSGWEGGKSYNSRDWGHHYSKSRDRDRDRDRERDWEREWHPRTGRDKGHSKFHHMGRKRYEGRISGRERSRDNFYHDKHDRDRDHPYEDHESGKDSPYPEIDY